MTYLWELARDGLLGIGSVGEVDEDLGRWLVETRLAEKIP